jgi:hypothetical protein
LLYIILLDGTAKEYTHSGVGHVNYYRCFRYPYFYIRKTIKKEKYLMTENSLNLTKCTDLHIQDAQVFPSCTNKN